MNDSLKKMAERWPSAIVARQKIAEFTGGLLEPQTMANLDKTGKGPPGAMRIGRKIVYDVELLLDWLESRLTDPGWKTSGDFADEAKKEPEQSEPRQFQLVVQEPEQSEPRPVTIVYEKQEQPTKEKGK